MFSLTAGLMIIKEHSETRKSLGSIGFMIVSTLLSQRLQTWRRRKCF